MYLIRIVRSIEQARETILKRIPFEEMPVPPQVSDRLEEIFGGPISPQEAVAQILQDVRAKRDEALRRYTEMIDGVSLEDFAVSDEEYERAFQEVSPQVQEAMGLAAERIRSFHQKQMPRSWLEWEGGGALGQLVRPLERVGIYAPGGRASYPSSLLMAAIPAQVAGVKELVVVTPPKEGGRAASSILVAARAAGVKQVFKVGGAQAIAALAYGTESIPKVDKIVGPGNIFVVLAKRMVFAVVGIDQLPGPTETLIIADEMASAALIAADLLAQAEHDQMASSILITPSEKLALAVQEEIDRQAKSLSRREIITQALEDRGGIIVVRDLAQAIELANEYAPEHLCLLTAEPWKLVGQVRNAGGIFLGETSPEAVGDYVVGPSHIMPTGGSARFSSPLNVNDFLKVTSIFALDGESLEALGPAAIALAEAEGLTAHAAAIKRRMQDSDNA